jgi:hypothetical protein
MYPDDFVTDVSDDPDSGSAIEDPGSGIKDSASALR